MTARSRLRHLANAAGRRALNGVRQFNHWALAQVVRLVLTVLRRLPADRAMNFADRTARRLGPLFGRHRTALGNLREAYPEKSEDEIRDIALDMWGNMGRLAAEYIFLDQIFDYDYEEKKPGRIDVVGRPLFMEIAWEKKPRIVFTAHLGNFELLPICAAAFGMEATVLFRSPNNPYIADYIHSTRASKMGGLQNSERGAAFALASILEDSGNIGLLVDQKFAGGLRTTFFGRVCETNPMLAILARRYNCDVYPTRCVRLPGGRFRMEIEPAMQLARDETGEIDLHAATQQINDVVERWVRENPGQWMWFHKRWNLSAWTRNRRRKPTAPAAG